MEKQKFLKIKPMKVHEQLRDLLEKDFTNKYIKLSPVVDYNEYPKSTLEVDLEKKLQKLMQPYLKKNK